MSMLEYSSSARKLQGLTNVVLIFAIIISIPFMFYAGKPSNTWEYIFTCLFVAQLVVPYIILLITNRWLVTNSKQALLVYLIALLAIGFALGVFYYGFFYNLQGQNGLLLIIVPFSQIVVSVVLGGMLFFKKRALAHKAA